MFHRPYPRFLLLLTLLAVLMAPGVSAQVRTVTGVVAEEEEEPLPGVALFVKGTTHGVVTDSKGLFRISASPGDVLVTQCLGYIEKEITLGEEMALNIVLVPESRQIDAVVVTALGITREQRSLGYAVTTISSDDLGNAVSGNWLNNMSGKVAGLNFDNAGAGPGGSIRVTLRGESSLSHDNNTALFVVDGIPISSDMTNFGGSSYSDLDAPVDFGNGASDLNPDDIESVTVLKGPSATALYGSRAANGAIIITTKKGRAQQGFGVTVSSSVTFEQAGYWPDFQNEYGAGNGNASNSPASNGKDARRYYSFWAVGPTLSDDGENYPRLQSRYAFGPRYEGQMFYTYGSYDWDTDTFTKQPWEPMDWYKGFFRTGVTYTNSISVDGNNGKGTSVRIAAKDIRNKWIVPNTGYDAQNFSLSLNHELNKWIRLGAKVTYYRKNSDNLPTTGYSQASPLYALMWTVTSASTRELYDEWASGRIPEMIASGDGGKLINNGTGSARSENAYWLAYENLNTLSRDRVYGNFSVTVDFTDHLSLMMRTGMDMNYDFATQQKPQYTNGYNDGFYREQSTTKFEMNNDFLLSYTREFGRLYFNASAGGNNMVNNYRFESKTAEKLSTPNIFQLQNAASGLIFQNTRRNKSINSFYGLVSLGWQDTYYLDITARNDWSSTLPKGNNSYFYPSVSASVLLDKVFGLKEKAPWLDMLKVRGSWANVGNDTNPYNTQEVYLNGIFTSSYYLPTTERNPQLKPENVESWEAGLELMMFRGRWNIDAAFYTAATTNQIISSPIDGITGARYKVINAGKVTNKGVELSTSFQPVKTRDFRWDISLNWAYNKNRLVELADGVEVWQVNSATVGSRVYIYAYPGTELGRVYGWGYERAPKGSFYVDEDGNKVDCSGEVIVNSSTGNPVLNTEDLKDLGSIYPDWKAGMTQNFRYKNFQFGFTFAGQKGGKAYSVTNFALFYTGKLKNSLPGRYEGLVHEGVNLNSDGTYRKNTTITTDIVDYYNTFVWNRDNAESNTFSTSYLKLREVRADYSLPAKICAKTGFLQGASIGVYATNLFCWSNFPQYDPDAASMNGSSIARGIEQGAYPMTRSYGFNLKLTF
ncbi:MAG: SusC/RagA family TonB-linked outer membrane protein [Rikenellaceae bacterium]|nr:SusC/RagA family TonB-linked outer membrane protein [Rikenellaceae bacterium]